MGFNSRYQQTKRWWNTPPKCRHPHTPLLLPILAHSSQSVFFDRGPLEAQTTGEQCPLAPLILSAHILPSSALYEAFPFAIYFSSALQLKKYPLKSAVVRCLNLQSQKGLDGGRHRGEEGLFLQQPCCRGGPSLSERLKDLKFWRLNERNTQLTKQCTTEEASSGLAKSLLSFHLFSPNNSCPLIPCYSAVKNKTSLWLSVFLFFPRVGLITGD